MKRFTKIAVITLAGVGALAIAAAPGFASGASEGAGKVAPWQPVQGMMISGFMGQPMMNFGMMGPGMMGPGMMGPGMIVPGVMGPGMMGYVMLPSLGTDLNLSVDDVRGQLDQSLTWHGNKRIKVGDVKALDDNTIVADVITQDGSLVQRFEVNRHTGRMLQAQ